MAYPTDVSTDLPALGAFGARSWVPLPRLTPLARARTEQTFAEHLDRARAGATERAVVLDLLERSDYRIAAGALRALDGAPGRFELLAGLLAPRVTAAGHAAVLHNWATEPPMVSYDGTLRVVGTLDDLLAGGPDETVALPLAEGALEVVDAIQDAGHGDVGRFLEAQLDLAGTSALLRGGLVRQWVDPVGAPWVSKRSNPLKPGRLERELRSIGVVADRLAAASDVGTGPRIVVPLPIMILKDGRRGTLYSITPLLAGGNQFDRLLVAADDQTRRSSLSRYREVLERLYSAGVVWGDMSPRNMLVDDDGTVAIVDFEKTTIVDPPVSMAVRVRHCRGQAGAEELQMFASTSEVVDCLDPYMDPGFSSTDTGPASWVPRAELAELLLHRGVDGWTRGELHQLELDVMAVREPFTKVDGVRVHPGLINHKIDAYLEMIGERPGRWDSQVTEILLAGRSEDDYEAAVGACTALADELESAAVLDELRRRLGPLYSHTAPRNPAAGRVMAGLDALMAQGRS